MLVGVVVGVQLAGAEQPGAVETIDVDLEEIAGLPNAALRLVNSVQLHDISPLAYYESVSLSGSG